MSIVSALRSWTPSSMDAMGTPAKYGAGPLPPLDGRRSPSASQLAAAAPELFAALADLMRTSPPPEPPTRGAADRSFAAPVRGWYMAHVTAALLLAGLCGKPGDGTDEEDSD